MTHDTGLAALGVAAPDETSLTELVKAIIGRRDAVPASVRVEEAEYTIGTPTTEQLARVYGTALLSDGSVREWSCFVKRLQSPKLWRYIHLIPAQLQEELINQLLWRLEVAAYTSDLHEYLPEGLRLPTVFRIDELGDDRATIWMENVVHAPGSWDLARFGRAAHLLGRLSARRRAHLVGPILPRANATVPGMALRFYAKSRTQRMLAVLSAEDVWHHPLLREVVARDPALRSDVLEMGEALDSTLTALSLLPQAYPHGDASPQNLLVPVDAPTDFVAIDWLFDSPEAIGLDLGQLLVGLAHSGVLEPEELHEVHPVILESFQVGLAEEGMAVEDGLVEYGYLGSLMIRSAFTALPLEQLDDQPTDLLGALFNQRGRLTRVLVDLIRPVVLGP
ncbi:phosphotransferase [Kribbella sp. CA-253562]|uniref:phosphotransferase n=1 Tax=Kribbella sp. CA-253562 TaxID=3239942 RepID=UPI003D940ADD